jgi:hypothetical protein
VIDRLPGSHHSWKGWTYAAVLVDEAINGISAAEQLSERHRSRIEESQAQVAQLASEQVSLGLDLMVVERARFTRFERILVYADEHEAPTRRCCQHESLMLAGRAAANEFKPRASA